MTNDEIVQDFRRRYEGTFVWLEKQESQPCEGTLVRVDAVQNSPDKLAVMVLSSREYGKMQINFDSDEYRLLFKYPPVGVFQHRDDACLFRRRAERQYTRGLCLANSVLHNTTRGVIGVIIRFDVDSIAAAYKKLTYAPQHGLERLRKGLARSVALPDDLSISLSMSNKNKDYIIFHWDIPIARCDEKGKITQVIEGAYSTILEKVFAHE